MGTSFFKHQQSKKAIGSGRFDSVIDFPNFLMHVLRIYIITKDETKEIPALDDKSLLQAFNSFMDVKTEHKAKKAKDFIFLLLNTNSLGSY